MSKDVSYPSRPQKEEPLILEGPYRNYRPADTYWLARVGQINILDKVLGLTIAVGFAAYMLIYEPMLTPGVKDKETELYEAIGYYRKGNFYLGPLPPFGFQLYSLFPFNIDTMRKVSLSLASATLLLLYLILRRTNTNRFFAAVSVILIAYLPLFRDEASSLSFEALQWTFLSMSLYSWQSLKCSKIMSRSWLYNFSILGVSLGLVVSTKFIGLFTWIWISALALIEFWNILNDVRITNGQLWGHTAYSAFFLGIMPLTIFISSYVLQLNNWQNDSPQFSTYMSQDFKTFLRGPQEHPKQLYYGSIITLRHLDSLGGYLHSHNHSYRGGSQEQQVTLTEIEDDYNNEWIVEHRNPSFNEDLIPRIVKDLDRIKLRHRATGKLLRASTAKPPASEQEYDLEVSCTGDSDYVGNSDEIWSINAINGGVKDPIEPLKAVVRFNNEGQRCTMIGHDLKLPDWGFNQQEVLCLEFATKSRALFGIEKVRAQVAHKINYITDSGESNTCYKYLKLIYELIKRQYKYNYYEKNYKLEGALKQESWPFYISGNKYRDSIWISTVASLSVFVLYMLVRAWKFNPWEYSAKAQEPLRCQMYQDFGITCSLGWLLHYYPLLKSPHDNVDIVQYMPSLFIGQLLVSQTLYTGYKWHSLVAPCICCFIAFVIHYC